MTRLLVIGASGLDWGGFDRLTRAGELPKMARLRLAGSAGWLSGGPAVGGPAPFASMVSGHQPEVHGLWRAREAWAGGTRPVSRASWRAPPVWARLEAAGVRTGSVSWPGTRPGAEEPGTHVDEDFTEPSSHDPADWALPLHCAPADAREALRARRVHPRNITGTMLLPLMPDLAGVDLRRNLDLPVIASAMAAAATTQAAAVWMLESRRAEAVFIRHAWLGRIRAAFGRRSETVNAQVVPAAWRLLDGFVGRLVEAAGPQAQVLLVSPGWFSAPGLVLAGGEGVTPDPAFRGAGILDIAPTILGRFGLMESSLPGRPIPIAAPSSALRTAPRPPPAPERRPEARTMYVVRKAGYPAAPRAPRAWRAQGLAELAWMVLERDPKVAGDIAGAALRLDPRCILALRAQVRARVALEQADGLDDLGKALLDIAPDRPWGALALGAFHILCRKTSQAAPWLVKAEADTDTAGLMTVASLWLAGGRPANAERVFRAVLARDPLNVSAEIGVALAATERRDYAVAELALQRALAQDPGRPAIQLQLARLYAKTGRRAEAFRAADEAANLGASRAQAEAARRGRASL